MLLDSATRWVTLPALYLPVKGEFDFFGRMSAIAATRLPTNRPGMTNPTYEQSNAQLKLIEEVRPLRWVQGIVTNLMLNQWR